MTPLFKLLSQSHSSVIKGRAKDILRILSTNQANDKRKLTGNWTHFIDKYVGHCASRGNDYQHVLQYRVNERRILINRLTGAIRLDQRRESCEQTMQVIMEIERNFHWKEELNID